MIMPIARSKPPAAVHVPFARGGLGFVGCFVGPTQAPLTAHFTTEVGAPLVDGGGEPAVDPGGGGCGTTAVVTGGVGETDIVPILGFTTTLVFVGAGPPSTFGLTGPGPPTTTGFFAPPPIAVCAKAGLKKAQMHRKLTEITAPLFMEASFQTVQAKRVADIIHHSRTASAGFANLDAVIGSAQALFLARIRSANRLNR
jgi:hypothetical protein